MDELSGEDIFSIERHQFTDAAIRLFRYQFANNDLYCSYVNALNIDPESVRSLTQIPFLPVSFFKTHQVQTGPFSPEIIFESSGTTTSINSRHFVKDLSLYRQSFNNAFTKFYGEPGRWCIIGLLPSYLERTGSSLVYMVNDLIQKSGHRYSGFYLYNYTDLFNIIMENERLAQPTLLIGVSFALLDFAQGFQMKLKYTIIMETGGMKGRKKEITRAELHNALASSFGVSAIHSEYGMTELLSQAYAHKNGIFFTPQWMRVLIRSEDDPMDISETGRGLLNIIDLANRDSCAFLAVDDMGTIFADGSFEVSGRADNSDIRGCSLLAI